MIYHNTQIHNDNGNSFRSRLPADVNIHSLGKISGKRLYQLTELIDDILMTQIEWRHVGSYDERVKGPFSMPLQASFELHASPYGPGYLANGKDISKIQPIPVSSEQVTYYDIGRFLAVAAKIIPQSRLGAHLTDEEKNVVNTIVSQNKDLVAKILIDVRAARH